MVKVGQDGMGSNNIIGREDKAGNISSIIVQCHWCGRKVFSLRAFFNVV